MDNSYNIHNLNFSKGVKMAYFDDIRVDDRIYVKGNNWEMVIYVRDDYFQTFDGLYNLDSYRINSLKTRISSE